MSVAIFQYLPLPSFPTQSPQVCLAYFSKQLYSFLYLFEMQPNLFHHPAIDRYLNCFHFLGSLCVYVCVSRSVVSDSLQPHGLYSPLSSSVHGILQARICPWNSPGKNLFHDISKIKLLLYFFVLFLNFLFYSLFTMLCQFLLYSKVIQLYIYIYVYPLPFKSLTVLQLATFYLYLFMYVQIFVLPNRKK